MPKKDWISWWRPSSSSQEPSWRSWVTLRRRSKGVRVLGPLPTSEIAKVLRGELFALPCRGSRRRP